MNNNSFMQLVRLVSFAVSLVGVLMIVLNGGFFEDGPDGKRLIGTGSHVVMFATFVFYASRLIERLSGYRFIVHEWSSPVILLRDWAFTATMVVFVALVMMGLPMELGGGSTLLMTGIFVTTVLDEVVRRRRRTASD